MYFQKINTNKPAWNINFDIPKPGPVLYERHYTNVEEIIPPDLPDKFKSINMIPEYVRLFVWPVNHCGIWHIDGTADVFRQSALNWVIKGSGYIQFNSKVALDLWPGVHRGYQGKFIDRCESMTDGNGCVINTSACHRVITGKDGRNTISLGWKNNDISFELTVEKLRQINMI